MRTDPDLVLVGARVWTGGHRGGGEAPDGVAVTGDRITAVGPASDVLALAGPRTPRTSTTIRTAGGSRPGCADLAPLSEDVFAPGFTTPSRDLPGGGGLCDAAPLADVHVELTVSAGRVVHDRLGG